MKLQKRLRKLRIVIRKDGFVSAIKIVIRRLLRYHITMLARVSPKLLFFLKTETKKYNDEYWFLANPIFQITKEDIEASNNTQQVGKLGKVTTATWFVPNFNHLAFGGIYTIFRFISGFAAKGVHNRIIIYDNKYVDGPALKNEIVRAFPNLTSAELIIFDNATENVADLAATDIAVCTFWVSAYFLLKFNKARRKYYFIQDYEPLFYPGGSTYALAESTYRFGFKGIVNTPGLLRAINMRHGLQGVSFIPAVDGAQYYPGDLQNKSNRRLRIFFYARPNNPRNAFELGILIIQLLQKKYGNRIEIVTAGAVWNESDFGLRGAIINMGLLNTIEEVGNLYRSCDIGFVYMLSKHPSYQPFEFMACGMATVTNRNEDNLWFLKDGSNCLIAEPSPAAMAEKIGWLIDDPKLLDKIKNGGASSIDTDWQQRVELVWNDILYAK